MLTTLPTVEEVIDDHKPALGPDRTAYRNHVYRVVNLCLAIAERNPIELEQLAVAAVFHDLGIWTNHTFDYIGPSVALAREHLMRRELAQWIPEIEAMIVNHHKVTTSSATAEPSLVESFRRADWIDVTYGLRSFGLSRALITSILAEWPDAGFHRRLIRLEIDRLWRHPLSPIPMVRW